jgi:hypothetical protein
MKIDVPLKPPELKRDEMGRFERRGAELIKKPEKTSKHVVERRSDRFGGPGPGRPPGSKNKTTLALKEAILAACEAAGGKEGSVGYLHRLAIENSSAFASLLGKVLPTTLAADESNGGAGLEVTFRRIIVYPGGREEIEGVTPKQLPAPASPMLPNSTETTVETSDIKELDA